MEIVSLSESLLTNVECYKLFLEQHSIRQSLQQQQQSIPFYDTKLDKQMTLYFEKLNPTSMGLALEMHNKEIQIKQSHIGQPPSQIAKHLEKGLEETACYQFLSKLQELFDDLLTEEERLQLLNSAPKTLVEIHLIVDHCAERLTEQQTLQILNLVQEYIEPQIPLVSAIVQQKQQ